MEIFLYGYVFVPCPLDPYSIYYLSAGNFIEPSPNIIELEGEYLNDAFYDRILSSHTSPLSPAPPPNNKKKA
jgi:hypothetical protein